MMTSKRGRSYTRVNPVAKYAHRFNKSKGITPKKVKDKLGYIKHKNSMLEGIDNE